MLTSIRPQVKRFAGILEKFSTARFTLEEQMNRSLAKTTARYHEVIETVIDNLVEETVPQMIEEKAEEFDEKLDASLLELSTAWKSGVRAEVRAVASEFIWADIKKAPKGIEWLEKQMVEIEARVDHWIKEMRALDRRVTDTADESRRRSDALKAEDAAIKNQYTELNAKLGELHSETAGLRQENNEFRANFESVRNDLRALGGNDRYLAAYVDTHHACLNSPHVPGI